MDDTPHDPQHDMARRDAPMRDQPRQTPSPDTSHFTMTVEAASARFADAGLPRSIRSIQRYCQRGHLSCTTVDTEIAEMYVIDPNSVERRIRELQQIEIITQAPAMSRQDVPSRDATRHDATGRDASRQASSRDQREEYDRRIKELEDKAMHLEIDKRAKEQIINMLKEDREIDQDAAILDCVKVRELVDEIALAVYDDERCSLLHVVEDQLGKPLGLPCPGTADHVHVRKESILRHVESDLLLEVIKEWRPVEVEPRRIERWQPALSRQGERHVLFGIR